MRATTWLVAVGLVGALGAGCARQRGWQLLHPPERQDADAPGGVRLLPRSGMDAWRVVHVYPTEAACQEAKATALNEQVVRARAAAGDDAKYDLDLRRAVHARCLPTRER